MQRQKARFSLRSIRQLNPGGFLLREEKHLNKLRRGGEKSTRENPEFHEEIPPLPFALVACLLAFRILHLKLALSFYVPHSAALLTPH